MSRTWRRWTSATRFPRSSPSSDVIVRTLTAAMLAVAVLASSPPAGAQVKPARVAVLCGVRCDGPVYDTFRQTLRELGRVEGQNLVIDVRGAGGQPDRLPALASELLAARP